MTSDRASTYDQRFTAPYLFYFTTASFSLANKLLQAVKDLEYNKYRPLASNNGNHALPLHYSSGRPPQRNSGIECHQTSQHGFNLHQSYPPRPAMYVPPFTQALR